MQNVSELIDLLLLEMPIEKQRQAGFMDIVEVQYHENTISRIYSYFLHRKKNQAIAELFLTSLLQIVKNRSSKDLEFGNHFCQTERQTDKGNRIDMLIKTGDEHFKEDDYALIIENKIFSPLRNDLLDYWDSIKIPTERKVGILLTLRPHPIPENVKDYFINVTHAEWMSEIRVVGLPYDLDTQQYVYLNDFIRNMENIVTSTDSMSEDAKFFFDHTAKILRARKTYDAAWTHVVNQLKIFSEKMGMQLYGNSGGWRHIWNEQWHVYYVMGFDQTLKEDPSIRIYLEVFKDGIARKDELRQLLNEAGFYNHLQDDRQSSQSWAHLAFKDYKLSKNELEHLGVTLHELVTRDFRDAFELVKSTLHKQVDLSTNDLFQ